MKTDGRKYKLQLKTDERFAGSDITFSSFFEAEADEWNEIFVPFSDLEPAFRGTPMPDYSFDPAKVEEVGFMLNEVSNDRIPGDFEIQVKWIAAV